MCLRMFVSNSNATFIRNDHPVDDIARLESGIISVKIEQSRNQPVFSILFLLVCSVKMRFGPKIVYFILLSAVIFIPFQMSLETIYFLQ